MKITFWGGVGEVTGSRHLIETDKAKVMMDCGMFQGHRKESIDRNKNFPFPAKDLSAVLLSHAHIDHSGLLPTLPKNGYKGPIYCTPSTVELCQIMLMDSAHLQEEDAKFFNKKNPGSNITPLYGQEDARACLEQFRPHEYLTDVPAAPGVTARFFNAGHVLGSAMIQADLETPKGPIRVLFTGDLGRRQTLLLDPPHIPENVDYLLIESTYGDRVHEGIDHVEGQLKAFITRAAQEKSKIIIPSFALERTQEIVFVIEKLLREKAIPMVPVYVDSPSAVNISDVFNRHLNDFSFSPEFKAYVKSAGDPFGFQTIKYVRSVQESMSLNAMPGPMVIISASGMCEGGRVLHHLSNNLDKPNTTVLIVGYQAEGTLGRKLEDGAKMVLIHGQQQKVNARVETMHTFSAHADRDDLIWFMKSLKPRPKTIFLVHGDPADRVALKAHLKDEGITSVACPEFGQSFELL